MSTVNGSTKNGKNWSLEKFSCTDGPVFFFKLHEIFLNKYKRSLETFIRS